MRKEKEFLEQIEQHKGILYKVSRLYTNNLEDQEDLRQEILIQLWKSYAAFRNESKFSSWMYRVAINTAITSFKNQKTFEKTEMIGELAQEDYNDTGDRQLELFYKAVQELSSIEKALMFYYMEGLSHLEIGNNLGISEGNARVKLSRTKEKLQSIIKKYNYEF